MAFQAGIDIWYIADIVLSVTVHLNQVLIIIIDTIFITSLKCCAVTKVIGMAVTTEEIS